MAVAAIVPDRTPSVRFILYDLEALDNEGAIVTKTFIIIRVVDFI